MKGYGGAVDSGESEAGRYWKEGRNGKLSSRYVVGEENKEKNQN